MLGGAKISGKIDVIEQLLPKVDALLIGGAMACTFFKAMGLETGKSLVEADRVDMAKELLERGGHASSCCRTMRRSRRRSTQARKAHAVARDAIPADEAMFDIGPRTARVVRARDRAARRRCCGTARWACSRRRRSTRERRAIAEAMATATAKGATTIVGGGDSAAAVAAGGTRRRR